MIHTGKPFLLVLNKRDTKRQNSRNSCHLLAYKEGEEQDLLQTDDGDFLLLLQLGALLRQLIVHLAAAHDHPLEALLLGGVGRPAAPHSLQFWPTLPY